VLKTELEERMTVFSARTASLAREGLLREMRLVEGSQGPRVVLDGREVLLLCSNDYLGLAGCRDLRERSSQAVLEYGTSSGASRLVSGNMQLHQELERRLATFKGTEAALLFNSGYAANSGIIPALAGRGDFVFSDRLNHASIVDGTLLSRGKLVRYPHNDLAALERQLVSCESEKGLKLVVTDGVFSMDGDLARLRELAALRRKHGFLLMVDDAHGTGVLGEGGRGTAEECGIASEVDIHMGTFGKALGSFGAYAAASRDVIRYLVNSARSFIFSTALPPGVPAASLAALDVVESSGGAALRRSLRENASFFRHGLAAAGFDTMGSETQIVPIRVGEAEKTMEFSRLLLEEGIFVQGIRPPTVPQGSCRLRCTLMASHTREDLTLAVETITAVGRKLGVLA
jgi:glycine C-acetyltransferase